MFRRRPPGIPAGITAHAQPTNSFADIASLTLDIFPDDIPEGVVTSFIPGGQASAFSAAGAARPTCQRLAYESRSALVFDGVDDAMTSAFAGSTVIAAAAYTAFAVVEIDAVETNDATHYLNDAIISLGTSGTAEYWGLHLDSDPDFRAYHWDGAAKAASVATAVGSRLLIQQRYNGTSIFARSGSAAESAGTAAGSVAVITGNFFLGRNYQAKFFGGKIFRVLVFNTSLSAGDITTVRERLRDIYGVTVA